MDACGRGHPFTPENTSVGRQSRDPRKTFRVCLRCQADSKARSKARAKIWREVEDLFNLLLEMRKSEPT